MSPKPTRAERRRAEREGTARSASKLPLILGILIALVGAGAAAWYLMPAGAGPTPEASLEQFRQGNPLAILAAEMNARCPQVLDAETRLDSVTGGPGAEMAYYYTLIQTLRQGRDRTQFEAGMRPVLQKQLAEKSETETLRQFDVKLRYHYRDANGELLGIVELNSDEY